jgi:mediator of RNA polymerase II transcription subunit 14
MDNLNTILSVRLSMQEFENIPIPFQNYRVDSGRVTFRIEGEFEVDLTVADEDFDSSFWFIDFRLLLRPAPSELPAYIREFLEQAVNEALRNEGLQGCYRILHEFVLTLKITEVHRQAIALTRARWADALKVERLHRAMSFQYWTKRYPPNGPQSWVIIGVRSGDEETEPQGTPSASSLCIRWFRDNKEVKDVELPFDFDNISLETLLTSIVSRHIEHYLKTLQAKFLSKPRFSQKHSRLVLDISKDDPAKSTLTLQAFDDKNIVVSVDPITGNFLLKPTLPFMFEGQKRLNSIVNLAEEVPLTLEKLRWLYTTQELHRCRADGWSVARAPTRIDELKGRIQTRELFQAVWLRHRRLAPELFIVVVLSLDGDKVFLTQL